MQRIFGPVVAAREMSVKPRSRTFVFSSALMLVLGVALSACGAATADGSETSAVGSQTSEVRSDTSAIGSDTSASRSEIRAADSETQVVAVMDSAAEQVVLDADSHAREARDGLTIKPRTASGSDEIAQLLRRDRVDAALYSVPSSDSAPDWEVLVHHELDPRLHDDLAAAVSPGKLTVTIQDPETTS
ncbi:MAG: hypothetical protein ACLGIA_01305 [Actinomycetes bacterium]